MTLQTVPLAKIVAGDAIDSRTTGRDADIKSLAASIMAHGLLQPLVVRNAPDGGVQVVAGNRRLAALQMLAATGDIDATFPVETIVKDRNDADAHELSLAENFQRLPPHPVDQYEAFARIGDEQKLDAAAIAVRFGTTERHVEKMLALGGLHPDIRKAWRAGDFRDDVAQAFTLARGDLDLQKKTFAKLKKQNQLWAHGIRSALGAADHAAGPALAIVGVEAYRAAGGTVTEDLFGQSPVISNKVLLQKLATAKVQAKCDELVADGWSFALDESTVEQRWNWRQVQSKKAKPSAEQRAELDAIEKRQAEIANKDETSDEDDEEHDRLEEQKEAIESELARTTFSPKQKKALGCFVKIGRDGSLAVEYGFERPEQTKAKVKDKAKKEREKVAKENGTDPGAPALSNSLVHDLSISMSMAVASALAKDDPRIALAAVYAALATSDGLYDLPLKIKREGVPLLHAEIEEPFEQLFAEALKFDDSGMMSAVARFAAQAIEFRKHVPRSWDEGERALLDALDPDVFAKAAREAFQSEDYFKRAPLAMAKAALEEMGKPVPKGGKKPELMAAAIAAQAETGWVPVDLRLPPRPTAPALAQAAE